MSDIQQDGHDEIPVQETPPPLITSGGVRAVLEDLLKHPGRIVFGLNSGFSTRISGVLLAIALVCLAAYGLTVGMFSWGQQIWAAPVKVSLGLLFSALICLPSLFIFGCLSGSRAGLAETCGLLAGTVALTSLLLLGFAPVSWIFAQSTESIVFMGVLHLVLLGVALWHGLGFLLKGFDLLSSERRGHLMVWGVIFVLVILQMTTTLRPLLGVSERVLQPEKKFFLTHWGEVLETSGKTPATSAKSR